MIKNKKIHHKTDRYLSRLFTNTYPFQYLEIKNCQSEYSTILNNFFFFFLAYINQVTNY